MNHNRETLLAEYCRHFSGTAEVYRAPGRVNLIGEHTDYNGGFAMPAAINRATYVAAGRRADRRVVAHSANFAETVEFTLGEKSHNIPVLHWSSYVRGIAAILSARANLRLSGVNLLIAGDVPLGAGLSSSASLEVAVAIAMLDTNGITMEKLEIALLCQIAEIEFAGTHCGILDQYAAVFGKAGAALLLDCRDTSHRTLPLPRSCGLVICNTMVKRELAAGEYNVRRSECEQAVAFLRDHFDPNIKSLRDISVEDLQCFQKKMPRSIFSRARHVVSENRRTLLAAAALEKNDAADLGELMNQSHESLRNDFEVSLNELDLMVELARKIDGFCGGRMMGGGFGGCTINLVEEECVSEFKRQMISKYKKKANKTPEVYICRTADGAGVL